jgi:hypothetical protein
VIEPTEPNIVINGIMLTTGQAMTLRVAVGNFLIELQDEEYLRALGEIGLLYRQRLIEISKYMMRAG